MFRMHLMALAVSTALLTPPLRAEDEILYHWDFDSPEAIDGWIPANQVKDMHISEGRLQMTMTGPDAFVIAPPVNVPLAGCTVRVRLRSDKAGTTQVYWQTPDKPVFGEHAQMARPTPSAREVTGEGADGFVTLAFPIGTLPDVDKTLTTLRIDPFNGNRDGQVEIDFVELVRTPPVYDVRFSALTHHVGLQQRVTAELRLRQIAGYADPADGLEVVIEDGPPALVEMNQQGEARVARQFRFADPGVRRIQAVVRASDGTVRHHLTVPIIVGKDERLPARAPLDLATDHYRLTPLEDANRSIGGMRWEVANPAGGAGDLDHWRLAGWLLPLGVLTIQRDDGTMVRSLPSLQADKSAPPGTCRLTGGFDEPGWSIDMSFEPSGEGRSEAILITATLHGPDGGRLLDFAGPILRCDRASAQDPLDRHAIFGGLEFLEPGWRSSSDRAVGWRFADRWSPHPFKITLPVMAVEADGVTSALMWQPLQTWNGVDSMPTATFASPNFLDDQPNHLMKLAVPTIPRWREENESLARQAYIMRADRPLVLQYALHAEVGTPVAATARRWYDLFVFGPAAPATHPDDVLYDIIARNYGETMWWPEEKGWRHHWYHLETESRFVPFMAAELIAHAHVTGETKWIKKTGIADRTMIDTAGTLAGQVRHDDPARAGIRSMRPDGTWPFENTDEMRRRVREFTQGEYESLGEDGSTSLGTCVQAALPILRYAMLTGDPACVDASIRALEAMRQFRVPRGAQVWEVHQEIPDIRAAALAVEAYHIGYQLTRDERFLDDAHYWAWTGVPFIYSWKAPIDRTDGTMVASEDRNDRHGRKPMPLSAGFQDPDRRVMPYATVPVLGPTFYVVNWFGVVVQWCGLEWAWKVIELDADRLDPTLRYIADAVIASGLQQMFDKPPWVGLYPDIWDTRANRAHGALISSRLPMYCLRAQGRIPPGASTWTRVLHDNVGELRWHVSGWGKPISLDPPSDESAWEANLALPPDQPNELVLANVPEPRRVKAGEKSLESRAMNDPPTVKGWRYDAQRRAVMIRFRQQAETQRIRVSW